MSQDGPIGLCFIAAHDEACRHHGILGRAKDYADDKFYRDLLRHFQGLRHPEDDPPFKAIGITLHWQRASTVSAIRRAAIREGYQPLSDNQVEALIHLFLACDARSVERVGAEIKTVETLGIADSHFLQPLAALAIDVKSVECFDFWTDRGARYDEDIKIALDWYFDYPNSKVAIAVDFLNLAFENDWRNISSDQEKLSRFAGKLIKETVSDGVDVLNWLLDHGAILSNTEIVEACCMSVHEDAMARLLQINARSAIRPPTIQAAAVNYRVKTMRLLLEAGAPVNTGKSLFIGVYWEWAEPSPMDGALLEIISPMKLANPDTEENLQKRVQMARLLLEHGADVDDIGFWDYSPRELVYDNAKLTKPTKRDLFHGEHNYIVPTQFVDLFEEFGYGPEKGSKMNRAWVKASLFGEPAEIMEMCVITISANEP